MIYKIRKLHNKKGFTLVEMLIGVLIFTLSLVSLMAISSKGLKAARDAEKQVVADYLAIEAIEVVRNIRDGAFLRGLTSSSWELVFQGGDIFSDQGCFDGPNTCNFYIPDGGDPIIDVSDGTVYLNKVNYYYLQTQGDVDPGFPNVDSGFKRTIEIDSVSPGQIFVLVKVSWDGGEVMYTENLFLWQ